MAGHPLPNNANAIVALRVAPNAGQSIGAPKRCATLPRGAHQVNAVPWLYLVIGLHVVYLCKLWQARTRRAHLGYGLARYQFYAGRAIVVHGRYYFGPRRAQFYAGVGAKVGAHACQQGGVFTLCLAPC